MLTRSAKAAGVIGAFGVAIALGSAGMAQADAPAKSTVSAEKDAGGTVTVFGRGGYN
ncbi:hypothetical protein [Saccharopolyspora sp. NPDC002376]